MNSPSPLIPQGSVLEQKAKSQSRVKVAFFWVIGVHIAIFSVVLLVQGCKREAKVEQPVDPLLTETNLQAVETYIPYTPTNAAPMTSAPPTFAEQPPMTTPPVMDTPPATATSTEYVVERGDNFTTIARKTGSTAAAIQAANPGIEPTRLQIGQKLVIPAPAATTTTTAPGGSVAPSGSDQIYVVKSGDTLSAIARKYNTTVRAIRTANNLTTDRIKVGDKLKIPASSSNGTAPTQ
jgi:LysM repeat protein